MAFGDIKAGGAYVELMLRKKGFIKGLKNAGKMLGKFAARAAAAAAAVGSVGLRAFTKLGDELDKMSKRTGLSVERLSELKHVADEAGTDIATVEKNVRRMQKSLVDAERGLSTATEGLAMIGLRLEDLQGLSPEEQFNRIGKAIAAMEDPSRKAGAAMTLLGRSGTDLIPFFDTMESGSQEAREMGLVMSTEAAQGAARLTDALSLVWKQLKMVAFHIGAAVAPLVERLLPVVIEFGKRSIAAVKAVGDFIAANTQSALQFALDTYVSVFGRLTFVVMEWRGGIELAMAQSHLAVVRFANQTKHFFTEVIPSTLTWLRDNWFSIFMTIGSFTESVVTNIGKNLHAFFEAVQGWLRGDGFEFKWTGLTEGFESSIKELPKIAEREMGPVEKRLAAEVDKIGAAMGEKFHNHMAAFGDTLRSFQSPLGADLNKLLEGFGLDGGGGRLAGGGRIFSTFNAEAARAQGLAAGKSPEVKAIEGQTDKLKEEFRRLRDDVKQGGAFGP